jgi:hypothetical protein
MPAPIDDGITRLRRFCGISGRRLGARVRAPLRAPQRRASARRCHSAISAGRVIAATAILACHNPGRVRADLARVKADGKTLGGLVRSSAKISFISIGCPHWWTIIIPLTNWACQDVLGVLKVHKRQRCGTFEADGKGNQDGPPCGPAAQIRPPVSRYHASRAGALCRVDGSGGGYRA